MYPEIHNAKLVSITPNAEEQIVYMARVSNPSNQNNLETAPKLIRYLIKAGHWSPFEMASLQVEINTTRAVAAQCLRHRSASFQEFSQRYSSVDQLPEIGLPHLRTQDKKNKQASHDNLDPQVRDRFKLQIERFYKESLDLYQSMLDAGIAKECARSVLPLGTPTRMYMSMNIRTAIHFCQVRCDKATQLEHRMIAEDVRDIIKAELPNVYLAAFELSE